jgi:hypothetical protein
MGLLLIFQTEQNPNEKRDKPKKEDLSRSVLKAGLEPARTLLFIGF